MKNDNASCCFRKGLQGLLIFVLSLIAVSCTKKDIEPSPLTVEIVVKDRNYSNVNDIPKGFEIPQEESLPFHEYVPTLYYQLRSHETGQIIEEQGTFPVTGFAPDYTAIFSSKVLFGTYDITVWGGQKDNAIFKDNALSAVIHAAQTEGQDIYLGTATVTYDLAHNVISEPIYMERVTSKLLIQVVDLPADICYSTVTVSQVYGEVNDEKEFALPVTVSKQQQWNGYPKVILSTFLGPSVDGKQPSIKVNLYNEASRATPVYSITIPTVADNPNLVIEANKITPILLKYNIQEDNFTILMLKNDAWESINTLGVE